MITYDQHLEDIDRFFRRGEHVVVLLEMAEVFMRRSTDFWFWSFDRFSSILLNGDVVYDDQVVVNMKYHSGDDLRDNLCSAELAFPKSILNIEDEQEFNTTVLAYVKTLNIKL